MDVPRAASAIDQTAERAGEATKTATRQVGEALQNLGGAMEDEAKRAPGAVWRRKGR